MYHDFYQLRQAPFPAKPNPSQVFWSATHTASFEPIIANLSHHPSTMMLLGQSGIGKTTLLRYHLGQLDPQQNHLIFPSTTALSPQDLLKQLYLASNCNGSSNCDWIDGDKPVLSSQLLALSQAWKRLANAGRRLLLVLDNAHTMPVETLELLHVLQTHMEHANTPMSMILVGQPQLEQLLQTPSLEPLAQRLSCVSRLAPFNLTDRMAYLRESIARAGGECEAIFSTGALKEIVRCAGGLPRDLNIICMDVLFFGHAHQHNPISGKVARDALSDLSPQSKPIYRGLWQWGLTGTIGLLLLASVIALTPYHQSMIRYLTPFRHTQPVQRLVETPPTQPQRLVPKPLSPQTAPVNPNPVAPCVVPIPTLSERPSKPAPTVLLQQPSSLISPLAPTPAATPEPGIPAALASIPLTPQSESIRTVSAPRVSRLVREIAKSSVKRQTRQRLGQAVAMSSPAAPPSPNLPTPARYISSHSTPVPAPRTILAPTHAVGTPIRAPEPTPHPTLLPAQPTPATQHTGATPPRHASEPTHQTPRQWQQGSQAGSPLEQHIVRFFAEPTPAQVMINGKLRGRTPVTVKLELGTYTIQVIEPGYTQINYTKTFRQSGSSTLYHNLLSEDDGNT